jgi:hypothetical protein
MTLMTTKGSCAGQIRVTPGASGCDTSSSTDGLSLFDRAACLRASAGSACGSTVSDLIAQVDFAANTVLESCDCITALQGNRQGGRGFTSRDGP